jgi:basic amino acid/polyamine antiporter, APA family
MTQPNPTPGAFTPDRWGERLPRRLGLWSAVAVLVGSTIGSGIFRTPAVVANQIDAVPAFFGAWVLGGVVALCGALTYAELAAAFPRSGGIYVFLREAFGPLWAFLFGWAEILIIRPAAYGAIGITSAGYAWRLFGYEPTAPLFTLPLTGAVSYEQLLAAVLIVLVAAVNYYGIHRGALLQNVTTGFKVAALGALVLLGFILGGGTGSGLAWSVGQGTASLSPFLVALVSILWAYDGWADLSFVGGEVKDPQRNLPKALLIGTAGVVILYLSANLVYLYLIPMAQMKDADLVAADAAQMLVGTFGAAAVSTAIAVSTFGTLNGSMMTAPRIFYAMAEDGLFFKGIARVNPRTGAPTGAIVLAAGLGVAFVLVRKFSELAAQFIIGIWPFYALAVAGVFVLRQKAPHLERPYRTRGYPWVPGFFLLASLFLLGNYLVAEPKDFLIDFGVIAVGVPVYYGWRRWAR